MAPPGPQKLRQKPGVVEMARRAAPSKHRMIGRNPVSLWQFRNLGELVGKDRVTRIEGGVFPYKAVARALQQVGVARHVCDQCLDLRLRIKGMGRQVGREVGEIIRDFIGSWPAGLLAKRDQTGHQWVGDHGHHQQIGLERDGNRIRMGGLDVDDTQVRAQCLTGQRDTMTVVAAVASLGMRQEDDRRPLVSQGLRSGRGRDARTVCCALTGDC